MRERINENPKSSAGHYKNTTAHRLKWAAFTTLLFANTRGRDVQGLHSITPEGCKKFGDTHECLRTFLAITIEGDDTRQQKTPGRLELFDFLSIRPATGALKH